MKIASLFTLPGGGATVAALRIAAAQRGAGHECRCFTLESPGHAASPDQMQGLAADGDVSGFWVSQAFRQWFSEAQPDAFVHGAELFSDGCTSLFPFQPFPDFLRQAEIVHLHWMAGMLFSPALLRLFRGKKILVTLHDLNLFTGGCHYPPACDAYTRGCGSCPLLRDRGPCDASWRMFSLKRRIYEELQPTFVAPSRWLAQCAQSSPLLRGTDCHCIPYPMDPLFFEPANGGELREQFGIPASDFVILVGADSLENQRKNLSALVEALRLLARERPNADLSVLSYGSGTQPELPYPVRAAGRVGDMRMVARLFAAADVYVHTSLQDNLPNTLCEAQAVGVPVVAFDLGGCGETMEPGVSGVLLPEPSPSLLAKALAELMDDPARRAAMREAARSFARRRFDPQSVAEQYERVMAGLRPSPGIQSADLWSELYENQLSSLATFYRTSAVDLLSLSTRLENVAKHVENMEIHLGSTATHVENVAKRLEDIENQCLTMSDRLEYLEKRVKNAFHRKVKRAFRKLLGR